MNNIQPNRSLSRLIWNQFRTWLLPVFLLFSINVWGQQNLDIAVPYSQSFGSLGAGAFTNNSTITGWYLSAGTVGADNGGNAAVGVYAYSNGGEVALGSNGGGAAYGVRFTNVSGMVINCVQVSFTGEQWSVAQSGTPGNPLQKLQFFYGTGSGLTGLSSAGTAFSALDFTEVQSNAVCGGSVSAIDGNANSAGVSGLISGLTVNPGEEIFIKWVDADNLCADHALAIDDVTVTAYSKDTPPVTNNSLITSTCSFVADWTAIAGATSYEIDVSTSPTFASFVAGYNGANVGNVNTAVVSPLSPSTLYYFRVRAVTPCGLTANSNVSQATTTSAIASPTATAATNIGCTSFDANWTGVSGSLGYKLDVATNASFGAIVAGYNSLDVSTATTFSVTGLTIGTTYFYRVRAVNECGTSPNSGTISVITLTAPSATVATAATNITACSFDANWTAISGATNYYIDVSTNNTFTAILPAYTNLSVGNVVTFPVTGLSASTTYYYRVRVENACGVGANSNIISRLTSANVGAVTATAATAVGCTSFNANWGSVAAATSYRLDVSTNNTFTAILPAYNDLNVSNVTTYAVTGLTLNTAYYYRLRAVNNCGVSVNNNTVTVTTLNTLAAPTATAATAVNCVSFSANWGAVSGATGYRLDVSTDVAFGSFVAGYSNLAVAGVTSSVTGLAFNTTYYYRVRTENACGVSGNSNTITVLTTDVPAAPAINAGSAISCNSFTASWSAVSGATSYRLDVSTVNTFASFVAGYSNLTVAGTSQSVTGLTPSTTYYVRVRAFSTACGASVNSATDVVVTSAIPAAPVLNAATSVTCTGFTSTWPAVAGATSYRFDVSTVNTFASFVGTYNDLTVAGTSRAVTGLTAGTTYYVRVRTFSSTCGTSGNSATMTVTTLAVPPAPVATAETNLTSCSFTANWQAEPTATGYTLQRATNNTFTTGLVTTALGLVTSNNYTGLAANTTYYYRLTANNTCGASAYSNIITVTTLPAPAVPTGITATAPTCNTFTAGWGAVANATAYEIQVATNAGFTTFVTGYNPLNVGNVTSYLVTGLNPNTTYYVRVRAYVGNACTVSAYSTGANTTTLNVPGTPTATAATLRDCNSFQANWTTIAGLTGYYLDVSTVSTFASFVAGFNGLDVGNVGTYPVTGLNLNTTYYYRLRGYNACGNTVNTATITTSTLNIPNTPTTLASTLIDCNSFQANWNAATGATSYFIDVDDNNAFTTPLAGYDNLSVTGTSLAITGLNAGTTYYYRIRATNACGTTVNSATRTTTTVNLLVAPTATAATVITRCSFQANWNAVTGAAGYFLDVAEDAGFTTFVSGYNNLTLGVVTNQSVTGLTPNTAYYYRVRATNACGTTVSSNTITVTTLIDLTAPTATAATLINCNQFQANWNAVTGATSYRIDVSTDPTFASITTLNNATVTAPTVLRTVTGLALNTTYYYRIRAVDACGTSTNSNVVSVTTLNIPLPPVATAATNITNCTFQANWLASLNATGYRLDVSTVNTFASFVVNNLNVGNVTTYTVTGLNPSTTYYYRLRAYNACGTNATNSNVINLTTLPNPTAPTATAATNLLCNGFTANWTSVTNAQGYFLDVSTVNTFASFVTGYNNLNVGNVLNYNVTGLAANTTYYFRVRAYIGVTCSPSPNSNIVSVVTVISQPAPVATAATPIGCNSFTANWNTAAGATSYLLDVSTNNAFTAILAGYNSLDVGNVNNYNVTGLNLNTTYYYRLRAYNSACTSAVSNTINLITLNVPGQPVTPTSSNITCSSFTGSWTATANATGYLLYVSTNNTFTAILPAYNGIDIGNVLTYDVTGLSGSTTYYYRIVAYNACGNSVVSNTRTVTTSAAVIATPTTNAANTITACSFNARWNNNATGSTYLLLDVSDDPTFTTFLPGLNAAVVTGTTSLIITGLTPSTNYYYRIRGGNPCGEGANSAVRTVTTNAIAVPTANAATLITQCSFTANWSAAANATGYELDLSTDPTFATFVPGYNPIVLGNVTSLAISGLTAGTTYYYRVRNIEPCGTSSNSANRTVNTLANLAAPAMNAASGIGCTNFTANWGAVTSATSYAIDVSTSNTFASYVSGYQDLALGNVTTYAVTGLANNTTYYYRVRAVNACQTGPNSAVSAGVLTLNVPNAPTANAATLITPCTFQANWATVAGATGYRLDIATNNTFTAYVTGYQDLNVGNVLLYSVTGLNSATNYYYRVRAVNACGSGPNSNTITATTLADYPAPVASAATLVTACSFQANWATATGATSYRLDVATDNAFTAFVAGYQDLNVGNVLLRSVTGLNAGTTYYYRVRNVNACGTSVNSNTITAITLAAPAAPTANAATAVVCTSFSANWSSVAGASSYILDVATDNAFTSLVAGYSALNVGNVLTRSVTGLTAGTTYYYRVRTVVGSCPAGGNSGTIAVTLPSGPAAVTANAATNLTCVSFSANWNTVAGATNGYRLDVSTVNTFASFVAGYNNLNVGSVTTYSVTGLTANTTYYYRVRAVDACTTGPNSGTITALTQTLPVAPVSDVATNVLCTGFTANWNLVPGITAYTLDVSTVNTFASFVAGYNNLSVGNVDFYNVTGLAMGTTYYYRVRSSNGVTGCISVSSGTQSITTANIPATPVTIAATNVMSCEFMANWNAASNASGYYLDVSLASANFAPSLAGYSNIDVGNVTSFEITGLAQNTAYRYRVRAYNACGTTANSNVTNQTTATAVALPTPFAVVPSVLLSCRFNAEWTSVVNATYYILEVANDAGFTSYVTGYNNIDVGNLTTYPVVGLTPNTTYYYRVRGANDCGLSGYSNVRTVTTPDNLVIPTTISPISITCNSFTARWNAVSTVQSYRLDVSTQSNFATLVSPYNNLDVGNVTSYSVTGLSQNTVYYYRIRAVNVCGSTANSNTTNTATIPVAAPTATARTNVTCTSFNANWNAVAGANDYLLDVSTVNTFASFLPGYNSVNTGNVTTFVVTGTNPTSTYYYRLRAINPACGTSPSYSNVITANLVTGTAGLWSGLGNDSDWNNCANWDNFVVPTSGNVVIPSTPTTTPQNIPTVSLNSFSLDNSIGVKMVGNMTLTTYLRLANGVINTQANKVIVLNNNPNTSITNSSNSVVTYANTNSYVAGTLERAVSAGNNYVWPIGTLTNPEFGKIWAQTVTGGMTSISGRFVAGAPSAYSQYFYENGAYFNTMLTTGYWQFDPNTGGSDWNLELWPVGFNTSCCQAFTFIKKHAGNPWNLDGSSPVVYSPSGFSGTGSLKRNGFSSFSDVGIVASLLPFPVEIISLNAVLEGKNGRLNWATASETNNKGFAIEHRLESDNAFEELGFVNGAGTVTSPQNYTFVHPNLSGGTHYYRLRQEDYNGSRNYSNWVELHVSDENSILASLYPNPTQGDVALKLSAFEKATNVKVEVFNMLGQSLNALEWKIAANETPEMKLPTAQLANGVYQIRITANGQNTTLRFVKE